VIPLPDYPNQPLIFYLIAIGVPTCVLYPKMAIMAGNERKRRGHYTVYYVQKNLQKLSIILLYMW
jgi:hypothetical protein